MIRRYPRLSLGCIGLPALIFSMPVVAQTTPAQGRVHTPDAIMKLMEASEIEYTVKPLKKRVEQNGSKQVLDSNIWIKNHNGRQTLARYVLPPASADSLNSAEQAFRDGRYDEAMALYRALQQSSPNYAHVHTLMGDVHYKKGDYRLARKSFELAIQKNFIDYRAHWFLADTLWRTGDRERAVQEIALGHLLNVNHQEMKRVLHSYRRALGRPWKDWEVAPQYRLSGRGKSIIVETTPDWAGYALVKAYWKYEPGYAERMAGPDCRRQVFCGTEEKEAMLSLIGREGAPDHLQRIAKEGFFNEMLLYEIAAKRAPSTILRLPKAALARIVTYLGRYH